MKDNRMARDRELRIEKNDYIVIVNKQVVCTQANGIATPDVVYENSS